MSSGSNCNDCNAGSPAAQSPRAATWRRVIEQAKKGDARHLLELLLQPTQLDGQGNPMPGSYTPLPQDGDLRVAIVRVLMFGPWAKARFLQDVMTRTGWGVTKPALAPYEVDMAALMLEVFGRGDAFDTLAETYGVEPETLAKMIAKRRRSRRK